MPTYDYMHHFLENGHYQFEWKLKFGLNMFIISVILEILGNGRFLIVCKFCIYFLHWCFTSSFNFFPRKFILENKIFKFCWGFLLFSIFLISIRKVYSESLTCSIGATHFVVSLLWHAFIWWKLVPTSPWGKLHPVLRAMLNVTMIYIRKHSVHKTHSFYR